MAEIALVQVQAGIGDATGRHAANRGRGIVSRIGRVLSAWIVDPCDLRVDAMRQAPHKASTVAAGAAIVTFSVAGPRVVG